MAYQAHKQPEPSDVVMERVERSASPHLVAGSADSIFAGALWMVSITLILFFLPAINGFIGGLVGGYKVGSVKRAMMAAVLPAVVVAAAMWIIFALLEAPIIGAIAGTTVGVIILLADIGIFLGAAVGGAASQRRVG